MKTTPAGHRRIPYAALCALILCLGFGCSTRDEPPGVSRSRQAGTPDTEVEPSITPEQFFGKYVATDYAWCLESPPDPPDAWAKGYLHDEAAILPEVFAVRGVVILNPRYEIRHFPKSVEGDVPTGVRRVLSDFYGAGTERAFITVLDVYEPGAAYARCHVEIIDDNTLWETWDGPWIFEWRREGAKRNPIPLKERALGSGNR